VVFLFSCLWWLGRRVFRWRFWLGPCDSTLTSLKLCRWVRLSFRARCVADARADRRETWEQFLGSARVSVLEHGSWVPLGSERDETHEYGYRVLSHVRQPPSYQLRLALDDNRLDYAILLQFSQSEGEHSGCESWKRAKNLVESLYLEERDVSQDEQGPLLS